MTRPEPATASARRWVRWVDPFVLALLLNVLVAGVGLVVGGSAGLVLDGWLSGFSGLWAFAMQMVLMLALGHTLAVAPPVRRPLAGLAAWIAARRAPAFWITVATGALAFVHWGLGLVAGGLIARAAADAAPGDRVAAVRYVAAAYAGFIVWHVGLSGSAPLVVATSDHFLVAQMGAVPLSETIFSASSLLLTAVVILVSAVLVSRMRIGSADPGPAVAEHDMDDTQPSTVTGLAGGRLAGLAMLGVAALGLLSGRISLDLNTVILVFCALGLVAHGSLESFTEAMRRGLLGTVGIVIQFPLYGAIMGVMKSTGLATLISSALVAGVPAFLFPVATFLSAGFLNILVPSGGGQWAVQGPILSEAAAALDVPWRKLVLGFSWGDAWTNLIQPFWALPLMALTGVRAHELLPVSIRLLVASGVIIALGLLVV